MASSTYCTMCSDQGLTCLQENLILVRTLSNDYGATYISRVLLYQCSVCQGLYKFIYSSSYQTRNIDAEAGWVVHNHDYFKVGARNGAGGIQFPLAEARIYGYRDDSAT